MCVCVNVCEFVFLKCYSFVLMGNINNCENIIRNKTFMHLRGCIVITVIIQVYFSFISGDDTL